MSNFVIAGTQPDGFDLTNPVTNPVTIDVAATIEAGTSGLSGALQGETVAAWDVTNQGLILGGTVVGIDLLAGGTVTNAATALISGLSGIQILGIAGTVVNAGTLEAATGGAGVFLADGGDFTDQASGQIQSSGDGVTSYGSTAADNLGTINAGTTDVAIDLFAGGTVTNATGGLLTGEWGISIQGAATGSVQNGGVIIGGAQSGVFLTGGAVTNQAGGTISGNWGVSDVRAAGTVITSGSIIGTGGTAVTLPSGFANLLVDEPGAIFDGLADGGNVIGGEAVSTLELGATSLQGTLNGLGTNFIDFGSILVDPGARWLVSGDNTLAAGATLSDQGTLVLSAATLAAEGTETIGPTAGTSASVTVTNGAVWSATSTLVDGDSGSASLVINSLGSATFATLVMGASAGGSGSIDLNGAGSTLSAGGDVVIGEAGAGDLSVENHATAQLGGATGGLDVAAGATGAGIITVTGTTSTLSNTGSFLIGDQGLGNLSIDAGGTVTTSADAIIANATAAAGSSVNVTGTGSDLAVTGLLDVGVSGSGALSISNGASVTAGSLDAGNIISAVANISVTNASFAVSGDATVADDGTGVLSVLSGATFAAANLTIGSQGDSSGAVVVSGANSVVNIAGNLNVGTALGTGDLIIGPGGVVNAKVVSLQGQVVLENGELDPTVNLINQGQTAGGSGTIAAGDIVDEGVILAGGSKPSQKLLVVAGTVLGGGPWTINGAAQAQANGGAGILQINAGGTLELTGAVLNAGSTTFTDDVTPQSTYTVTNSIVDVNFEDAAGVLKLDDIAGFAGTIAAFQKGDSFVITGGTLSNLGVTGGNTLTVSDSGNGGTDKLIFASGVSAGGFSIVNNNTIQVACFAAGTRIETDTGPVAVEALAVGHNVVLAEGGDCEPIQWIGQRFVHCARHPEPETVWPVRVRAGAFGAGRPGRDLWLSPDHAVFVNRVLVPVKQLVNGISITQIKKSCVTYFHVELPRHSVIMAEGLPVESYLDTGDRANFHQADRTIRLELNVGGRRPPDTALIWETRGAAPLVTAGLDLAVARMFVDANASPRGSRSEPTA